MKIKGPYTDPKIKWEKKNKSQSKLYINSRSSTILPEFLGLTFAVHNGIEYKTFGTITPSHIGKKFGEFSSTKKSAVYKKRK